MGDAKNLADLCTTKKQKPSLWQYKCRGETNLQWTKEKKL